MKGRSTEALQDFSRALIAPVKFMAVMGLVLAVSVILQLEFMPNFIQTFGLLLKNMMDAMLNNLSLIFAIGIASSLAKRQKIEAALTALIMFLLFLAANNTWLTITNSLAEPGEMGLFSTGQAIVLGFQVVDMNVFLGIIIGILVAYFHNRYSDKELPAALSIYGHARFSFMILIPVILIFAILMAYIWPWANRLIASLSDFIYTAGLLGVFLYAFGNRFLVPTGLHHLLWMPFCFTAIGGTVEINGEIYAGGANIIYALMSNPGTVSSMDPSLRFAMFGFAKIFASIPIALAFMNTAYPENREEVKGQLMPSALVAVLAGITEPLDFTFAFQAPLLWLVHSLITGIGETVLWALGSRTYMLYGIIDSVVVNSVFSPSVTKFYITIIVGLIFSLIWYYVFKLMIVKFDMNTPGREALVATSNDTNRINNKSTEVIVSTEDNIRYVIEGLGGPENIDTLTNCFSRIRANVHDPEKVNVLTLEKISEQKGIFENGNNIQVVIGMNVQTLREKVSEELGLD
ncbi:PTS sugar transporter subunit IIC [Suicoccus acidiformans]|uniref:PTS sugar transporter subunit IIC n=1 Tax=Suicoccus acidiformans TaxID=2036206 RepID=A0A347WKW2_9LACT|nr:PTS transporter subunit EIIC [Suicoccus acidiformans]AXY25719.1 PTS sugar transporter subunit IIC [Suicoccus acidiformans]